MVIIGIVSAFLVLQSRLLLPLTFDKLTSQRHSSNPSPPSFAFLLLRQILRFCIALRVCLPELPESHCLYSSGFANACGESSDQSPEIEVHARISIVNAEAEVIA